MIRCETCNGTKKLMGMGMIEKSCHSCNGIGFVEEKKIDDVKEPEMVSINDIQVVKKKMGRPKKKV